MYGVNVRSELDNVLDYVVEIGVLNWRCDYEWL